MLTAPPRRRGPRARLVGAVLAALLALAAVLGGAAPAAAHATLVGTDPAEGEVLDAAPDVVRFTFDEPVSLTATGVQVFDAAGDPVESTSAGRDEVVTTDLPDDLDDGTYVVVWRAISADGHPVAGSLTFSVGRPSATVAAPRVADPDPGAVRTALSVAHGLGYVGLLVSAGLVLFALWVARGVRVDDAVRARWVRAAWWSAGLALLAGVAAIPLTGAYQQGLGLTSLGEADAVDLALVGDDLVVLALQALGLLVALTALRRRALATAGALVAALSPALVGHSRAMDPVWLVTLTDAVHLAAATTWLGGLVALALSLGAVSGRGRDAALLLTRFGVVGASVLGALSLTGLLMGWRILEGWAPLLETAYGRLLLVKVGLAVVVGLVAAWNRFRLLPSVTNGAVRAGHGEQRAVVLRVRRAVQVEAGLLVVLLGVTGFLVNQSPREEAETRAPVPARVSAAVLDDVKVLAALAPARRGPNTLTVQVQTLDGEPVDGFAEPVVSLRREDGSVDLGAQPVVPVGAGTYAVEAVLPSSGTWLAQVSLKVSEFDNPVTTVTLEVQ